MSAAAIVIVGALYVQVAIEQAFARNFGMSIMYTGYAFANIGAWILVK